MVGSAAGSAGELAVHHNVQDRTAQPPTPLAAAAIVSPATATGDEPASSGLGSSLVPSSTAADSGAKPPQHMQQQHAIQYVTTIRNRFSNEPDTYRQEYIQTDLNPTYLHKFLSFQLMKLSLLCAPLYIYIYILTRCYNCVVIFVVFKLRQFLKILHTYQKEQKGIKEVLEQVLIDWLLIDY